MNLQNAIRVAIEEGGYEGCKKMGINPNAISYQDYAILVLDPAFWQALSKARGWSGDVLISSYETSGYDSIEKEWLYNGGIDNSLGKPIPMWVYHSLRYFELRMTGQDEPKFWEDILK